MLPGTFSSVNNDQESEFLHAVVQDQTIYLCGGSGAFIPPENNTARFVLVEDEATLPSSLFAVVNT